MPENNITIMLKNYGFKMQSSKTEKDKKNLNISNEMDKPILNYKLTDRNKSRKSMFDKECSFEDEKTIPIYYSKNTLKTTGNNKKDNKDKSKRMSKINLLTPKNFLIKTPKEISPSHSPRHEMKNFDIKNLLYHIKETNLGINEKSKQIKISFSKIVKYSQTIPFIIKFLHFKDLKSLLTSFNKMRILIDNAIKEYVSPIFKEFRKFKKDIQIIKKKIIFSKSNCIFTFI